jgi:ABC-type uncharacterized transport system auxiliary subunit
VRPQASGTKRWRCSALVVIAVALPGCFTLTQPAPQLRDYRIDYPPPEIDAKPLAVTLRVPPFGVAAVYDRQAIVYRDSTYATGSYLYDRWVASPGSMIADLVARDLARSGLYRAVQQGPSILPSDYQLTAQIEEIEERYAGGGCTAHLRLRMLLLRTRATEGDPVVLRVAYAEDEPCTCNDAAALAAAMSRATERISAQMQRDVHDAIGRDQAAAAPAR